MLTPTTTVSVPNRAALTSAIRFAIRRSGVVLVAPQSAFLGAYVVVYGAALWTTSGRLGRDTPIVILAILAGLASIVVGLAAGWRRWGAGAISAVRSDPAPSRWLLPLALGITAVGLGALCWYFARIGELPLLMRGAEQGRVEAAERGGAHLRVLALLALPGSWLVVAIAVRSRQVIPALAAGGLVALVAAGWILTANRAPSFIAIEVAVVVALCAGGRSRQSWPLAGVLLALAVAAVVSAGVIGAVRLGSAAALGPPAPGQTTVPNRPRDYPRLVGIAIAGYAQVPVQNLRYTMIAIPDRIGWRLGLTYLQPIMTALPGHQTTFDADLKEALRQRYAGGGTVPGLLGESYANFGPLGWAIVPGLIAFALVWLFALARRQDTVAAWALYAFAIVHTANATISGVIVASPLPYLAIAVLGGATALETWKRRLVPPSASRDPAQDPSG